MKFEIYSDWRARGGVHGKCYWLRRLVRGDVQDTLMIWSYGVLFDKSFEFRLKRGEDYTKW